MFELYTQSARRIIFLARDEAMRYGSACFESEHFLLGILRENEAVASHIAGPTLSVADLRKEIEAITSIGRAITEPIEIPLSADCKRILTTAVQEAEALRPQLSTVEEVEALRPKQVTIAHFLIVILRVETSAAARILQSHGATILRFREKAIKDIRWADAPD